MMIEETDLKEYFDRVGFPSDYTFDDFKSEYRQDYGTPRHSGRYPWGSGKNPQRNKNFKTRVNELKKQGLSEREIAEALGIKDASGNPSVNMLRAQISRATTDIRKENIAKATKLKEKGWSNTAIAKEMGTNESTVRGWLKPDSYSKVTSLDLAKNALSEAVDDKKYIDIGPGTEYALGVSSTKMNVAIADLLQDGYKEFTPKIPQAGNPGKYTTMRILAPPDTTYAQLMKDIKNDQEGAIKTIDEHIEINKTTGEPTLYKIEPPTLIAKDRVYIRYKEEGGEDMDGVIQIRRGCEDLNLENSRYAQVRIGVEGNLYAKGMALYADDKDIPDGYDMVVNSNKSKSAGFEKALKPMYFDSGKNKEIDEPFSSTTIQHHYVDKNGKTKLSALNVIGTTEDDEHVEGSWGEWSKKISSQFLSKQDPKVAKKQLDLTYKSREDEYADILKITNPIVKKNKLQEFAESCDSDAVHLKAVGFPRQATQVILPFPSMKENEIYAPNFKDGEEVALVRFPHASTAEIPTLKVNNSPSNPASKVIYDAADAVGINPRVAKILSGADFDGDTVVVIPTKNQHLKTRKTTNLTKDLREIQDFEPKKYKLPDNAPYLSTKLKGRLMGEVSNLITDMTIKQAEPDEIARAIKHSMVVIDAQKHHLDYKQSEEDFNIKQLKEKYQNNGDGTHGASTLISRAKSQYRVDERSEYWLNSKHIDSEGNKIYEYTGRTRTLIQKTDPKTGKKKWVDKRKDDVVDENTPIKVVKNQTKSTKMAETNDAYTLLSGPNHEGSQIEKVYANYANNLKSLANKARLEYVNTKNIERNSAAASAYRVEVESLKNKLKKANLDKPLERKAQTIAYSVVQAKKNSNPDLEKDELKKITNKALTDARNKVYNGRKRYRIDITPKEWEAIQAGAFTNAMLKEIIDAADSEQVTKYATPKDIKAVTDLKIARMQAMRNAGFSTLDIAEAVGVSRSTVLEYTNAN